MTKAKSPPPRIDPKRVITRQEAAELLGLDPSRISQLMASGHITRLERGKTTLADAARGYAAYWQEVAHAQTKTSADSRMRDARAEEIEVRLAEKRRELLPLKDALIAVEIMVAKFRDELIGLPARFTRDMDLRRRLEVETDGSLDRIAKAFGATSKYFRDGGDPTAEALRHD